jgi:2-succinyl-5-enolpyruvyl-6-hydroxy-3-cyclohexene-1-carboxylate synthase
MIVAHKNVRILLSLLKQYDIRHFVISPGSRNIPLVKSVEDDPFFTCYSVVDERSAAYFAVGLTLELRVPVVITCTSAQATRNYMPGMTEAFYRKAPVLAVTNDYDATFTNQMTMQSIQQMVMPPDTANVSVDIPIIKDVNDEHLATRRVNEALDALSRNGGGPAHINLRINQHWIRGENELETARKITRHQPRDAEWPVIGNRRVLLFVGQHHPFREAEARAIESFVMNHDAVAYVNHISNYGGPKAVHGNLRLSTGALGDLRPDLVITIGGHLGDYAVDSALKYAAVEHWRVRPDGQYGDTYNCLTRIFECDETCFFERMARPGGGTPGTGYHDRWMEEIARTRLPDHFPLSHALVARKLAPLIPPGANLHFAILNSLRFWEFFPLDASIRCYSNVAGFGIDGDLSTFLGQSVASNVLNFLVIGDLSFFYDMNALGIRHLKENIRIILINNRGGGEFRLRSHAADSFGDDSNRHIAASGHFGDSAEGWVRNNHFHYLPVRKAEQLDDALRVVVQASDRPVLVEVFTTMRDDAKALKSIIDINDHTPQSQKIAQALKSHIPDDLKKGIKRMLGR